jgi:hypothetical protein
VKRAEAFNERDVTPKHCAHLPGKASSSPLCPLKRTEQGEEHAVARSKMTIRSSSVFCSCSLSDGHMSEPLAPRVSYALHMKVRYFMDISFAHSNRHVPEGRQCFETAASLLGVQAHVPLPFETNPSAMRICILPLTKQSRFLELLDVLGVKLLFPCPAVLPGVGPVEQGRQEAAGVSEPDQGRQGGSGEAGKGGDNRDAAQG